MVANKLRIGSRGSQLALWQANHIQACLAERHPGLAVEIEIIKTTGDKITDVALSRVGGKGLFTKEIEEALLAGRVDFAVHSLKDLPTELPFGLSADVITERRHGADALVSRQGLKLDDLPSGAKIGTSSLRRKVQLAALRPDLVFIDLRGNVDTRLARLERGDYDAIVLAQAGLVRLGLDGRITELFDSARMVPAAGQGALAIEYRQADGLTLEAISFLTHSQTKMEVTAEREFLHELEGGCQVPIGARAELQPDGRLRLTGLISDLEGKRLLKDSITDYPTARPGKILAEKLLAAGGREILAEIYGRQKGD